jgi:hypothetical protein
MASWEMVTKSQWLLIDGQVVLAEIYVADETASEATATTYYGVSDRLDHPLEFCTLESAQRIVARRVGSASTVM